jgi:hypothetical protein
MTNICNLYIVVNISYLLLNTIRILAMLAILAGASLVLIEFGVISSAVAQTTGGNTTMSGNMTGGNATAGNATHSGKISAVSSGCGPYVSC